MVNILTDELKNTRFILTILAMCQLAFLGVIIFFLAVIRPNAVSEGMMGLLTTLLGASIALVSVAYNSLFKAREEDALTRAKLKG